MLRPATHAELADLQTFDDSGANIGACIADKLDILARWEVLGCVAQEGERRCYVAHSGGGAVAFVAGDGTHFGRAGVPTLAALTHAAQALRVR
jgi:hypothetical protein